VRLSVRVEEGTAHDGPDLIDRPRQKSMRVGGCDQMAQEGRLVLYQRRDQVAITCSFPFLPLYPSCLLSVCACSMGGV